LCDFDGSIKLADKVNTGRIPREILDFFRSPGGHSLIIKGDAGTGKTTLALQLIEELASEQPEYYLSMRVSDEALFRQFPWLREKARRNEILKAGKAFLRRTVPPERDEFDAKRREEMRVTKDLLQALTDEPPSPTVVRTELRKLEGQIEAGEITSEDDDLELCTEDGSLVLEMGTMLPELELAYDIVENNLPTKSLIVLDSIEALSENYGIPAQRIVTTLQRDLVEHSNTNITYVLETSGKSILDYLGDGIISMANEDRSGRRVRMLIIEKMRGASVQRWKYLFTLQDGRLRVFEHDAYDDMVLPARHEPVPENSPGHISLGFAALDNVMGGAPRGGLMLLEIGENVPQDMVHWFETTIVLDQLSKRRGAVWFPQHSLDYAHLDKQLRTMVGLDRPSEYLSVLDTGKQVGQEASFVRVLEGEDALHDLRWDQMRYQLNTAKGPYIGILGFDAIEDTYGRGAMPRVMPFIDAMRRGQNVIVAEATSISSSLSQLSHQAKMHLKLECIDGTVLICGQKPFTAYFHMERRTEGGVIKPVLVPLL
jgi:KaiC/GvpD/RAD55 family RecA-like ATPase